MQSPRPSVDNPAPDANGASSLAARWREGARVATSARHRAQLAARRSWESPEVVRLRRLTLAARRASWSGTAVILAGAVFITLLILALESLAHLPNRGVMYLPVVAFIAYYWDWWHGAVAALLDLCCIYFFLTLPFAALKPLAPDLTIALVTDAASIAFVLAVVQLAANRRALAEREAARFAALNSVGLALAGELNEERLLRLIARTACDLTGAGFAAFTLRPLDVSGRPLTPERGERFHLAAVVGVTPEQEALLRRMALGSDGLLEPIFHQGRSVRVADAVAMMEPPARDGVPATDEHAEGATRTARSASAAQPAVQVAARTAEARSVPNGRPVVRSFLGAPLLDRMGDVRGGLLLGHIEPERFTENDERLLMGLAAQAATALENAQLYQAAHAQAQELDVIFESIADGVALVDAQGQTIRENGAAKTLRVASAPSAPDTPLDLTPTGARHSLIERVEVAGEPREYAISINPVNPADGVADTAAPAVDGASQDAGTPGNGRAGAVVVWHDVTEAQQLIVERRALVEAEARQALLQVVVDELPSGVYLAHGPDARLVLANRAALDAWGAPWRVGQPMVEFLHEHGTRVARPDGQPLPLDELATLQAARSGEPVRHHQEIIVRADGTTLPVLFNAAIVRPDLLRNLTPTSPTAQPGDEHVVVVVLQDLTPVKAAEQLKDEFIAMAAHELRTPMTAVKGYAEMLVRGAGSGQGVPLDGWQLEALDSIDQATTRLVDLTNDLLDVSRLQANRLELRREPHDLLALARRVGRRFQVTTQRHQISIRSPQEYVVADVDAPRMEQIIGNLLSNAIKYSPNGGEIVVDVAADEQAGTARMSIRDSGIGIPAEQQARLFERFARAENGRELGVGGTGLGLYLCRMLLAQMGGSIWLESQESVGTTVYFEVPLHAAEDEQAEGELAARS
jgi:two-component system phosphate regulon sensor histidine kinase PhoR